MKKVIMSLFLAGACVLFCACAGNAPEVVSTPTEPAPEIISSAEPAQSSEADNGSNVEPYPAATPEEAVKFLEMIPPRAFGFAEPVDKYEVIYVTPDLDQLGPVNGVDSYTMELHASYSDGSVSVFPLFIRTDLGAMYRYDDETGIYHEIAPYDYDFPQESQKGDNSGAQVSPKSNDAPKKSSENSNDTVKGYPEGGESAAILHLMRYGKDDLGLPAELREYVVRSDGEMEINGIRCYVIGVYADLGERMELMNTYWVAFDNSVVFATDLQTGGYKALPAR